MRGSSEPVGLGAEQPAATQPEEQQTQLVLPDVPVMFMPKRLTDGSTGYQLVTRDGLQPLAQPWSFKKMNEVYSKIKTTQAKQENELQKALNDEMQISP